MDLIENIYEIELFHILHQIEWIINNRNEND